jgi:hypothetical protein
MFGMFGMILFGANAASTLQAERIKEANRKKRTKKKTAGRTKPKRRRDKITLMGESTHSVKKQGRKAKAAEARPLSEFENRILAGYFFGRDNPKQSAGAWSVPE